MRENWTLRLFQFFITSALWFKRSREELESVISQRRVRAQRSSVCEHGVHAWPHSPSRCSRQIGHGGSPVNRYLGIPSRLLEAPGAISVRGSLGCIPLVRGARHLPRAGGPGRALWALEDVSVPGETRKQTDSGHPARKVLHTIHALGSGRGLQRKS